MMIIPPGRRILARGIASQSCCPAVLSTKWAMPGKTPLSKPWPYPKAERGGLAILGAKMEHPLRTAALLRLLRRRYQRS